VEAAQVLADAIENSRGQQEQGAEAKENLSKSNPQVKIDATIPPL
jgi:hypothetical protein